DAVLYRRQSDSPERGRRPDLLRRCGAHILLRSAWHGPGARLDEVRQSDHHRFRNRVPGRGRAQAAHAARRRRHSPYRADSVSARGCNRDRHDPPAELSEVRGVRVRRRSLLGRLHRAVPRRCDRRISVSSGAEEDGGLGMMRSLFARFALIAGLAAATHPVLADQSTSSAASTVDFHVEVLADGLDAPWGLALLPDGRMLLTERSGALYLLDKRGQRLARIENVPEAFVKLQGGLLDVAIHPQFETNSKIYLSLAHGRQKHNTTRVVRATLSGNTLTDVEVIFDSTPKG